MSIITLSVDSFDMRSGVTLETHFNAQTFYILSVVVLDETNISICLHFSVQNIKMSCDLYRASRRSNVNVSQ